MEALIRRLFIQNWQRKCVALLTALIIWIFVSHSITETKTIPSVPIRVVNLPADKTISGLLPSGILSKRISLTLSGSKDIIRDIEPGDLEAVIDASSLDKDECVVQLTKKNLVSLNPAIDLLHHITQLSHPELIVKLSRLVVAKVPVSILPPLGEAPPGYEFLGVWPEKFMHTVTGPEEAVQKAQEQGIELAFNLDKITKADLDALKNARANAQEDEISFIVPQEWKEIAISFHNHSLEELNDPEAQNLRIEFLRKEILPLAKELPIRIFYPLKYLDALNPSALSLETGKRISKQDQLFFFSQPLYIEEVSRLFVDIVKENMEIALIAAPSYEREFLQWSVEIIDAEELENTYVAFLIASFANEKPMETSLLKKREETLRKRFRHYRQKMKLYTSPEHKLNLESYIENQFIRIKNA